jgi:hypothetical protein
LTLLRYKNEGGIDVCQATNAAIIRGMRIVRATSALSRVAVGSVFAMALATGFAQQQTTAAPQLKLVPMPQDRVADSYEIYSQLLPGNQIEWGNAPRSLWLVEDTTKAQPPDSPCASGGMMNPHKAIQTPQARQAGVCGSLGRFRRELS